MVVVVVVNVLGIALKILIFLVFLLVCNILPCCPALLNCTDVDVHTVVLLGK